MSAVAAITVQAARGAFGYFNADQTDPVTLALTPIPSVGTALVFLARLVVAATVLFHRVGDLASVPLSVIVFVVLSAHDVV